MAGDLSGESSSEPLPVVEGLDPLVGLAAVAGQWPIYRRLLHKFLATHEGDDSRWQAMLQAGQRAEAQRLVHRLRGGAATLGLVVIEEAARILEEALADGRQGLQLDEPGRALATALRQGITALRAAL